MKSVQFNLRQMLAAMLVVAIISAIAAPFLRALPVGWLVSIGVAVGAGVATFGLVILLLVGRRQRFEAAAGKVLMQLRRSRPARWGRAALPATIGHRARGGLMSWAAIRRTVVLYAPLANFLAIACVAIAVLPLPWVGGYVGMIYCSSIAAGMALCVALTWWRLRDNTLDLCEYGVIAWGPRYFRWEQVKYCTWAKTTELKVVCDNRAFFAAVPWQKRLEVEAFLATKVAVPPGPTLRPNPPA